MSVTCSACGHDPSFDNRDKIRAICLKHHLQSEQCNPAGRELVFRDRGKLQIFDMCNVCDERLINTFLGEDEVSA